MSASARASLAEPVETGLLEPIRDVSQAVIHRMIPLIAAQGLAPPTFWPLHYLDRGVERHPGELARRMCLTPATLTASIDQLVALGYVVRRPSPEDRRQVVLLVTPKGRRTLDAVWRRFDSSMREVLGGISAAEIDVTARTLRTIAGRLRSVAPVEERS